MLLCVLEGQALAENLYVWLSSEAFKQLDKVKVLGSVLEAFMEGKTFVLRSRANDSHLKLMPGASSAEQL